jgi:dUTP pyrophosphatase
MKIKVKYHDSACKIVTFGEWFDLKAASDVKIDGPRYDSKTKQVEFSNAMISLGISMQLPKYFEASIVPRSSSFSNFGFIQANHFGVVDSEYCGDGDVWKLNAIAIKPVEIAKGSRICQFRINPSQKAPIWVKLKWLFTNKITFVEVDSLGNKDRGGFGSTKF